MSNHQEDTRFSLFGPRGPNGNSRLTQSDSESDANYLSADRVAARTIWDGDSIDNPADVEYDRTWRVLLMQMLGQLEFGFSSLSELAQRRDPLGAVRVASAMVNQVADFIGTNVDQQKHARPISDALAAAGRFLTAAQVANQTERNKGFFSFFSSRSPENQNKVQECLWVLRDLPLVLERFFMLLSGCFRGQKSALAWVDTSSVFIGELKQTLSWVE